MPIEFTEFDLTFFFVRFDNRMGSLQLTVYCPFWMINKTDLMLSYRVSIHIE